MFAFTASSESPAKGRLRFCNEVQFANAQPPIFFTPFFTIAVLSAIQPSKALFPKEVTPPGTVIETIL